MMTKVAINKCPICGGWVALKTKINVDATYILHEDEGKLNMEGVDIIDRVYKGTPIKITCDDCGRILEVINVDAEKREFAFRANIKTIADIEKECEDYERGKMLREDSEVEIGIEEGGIWLHDYSPSREGAMVIKKLCEEDEVNIEELRKMCDQHDWSTVG